MRLTSLILLSGHIGITVDDTYKACERFERLGVEFVKKPDDGNFNLSNFRFCFNVDKMLPGWALCTSTCMVCIDI